MQKKIVNNFLNNAEYIILCRMLEKIYVENNEQFLWETDLKNCSLHMFVCLNEKKKITYFYAYVYLLIIEKKKKE